MVDNIEKKPVVLVLSDKINEMVEIEDHLPDNGFDVITASDGYEGLLIARKERPNLIITSLKAKRISGAKLAKLLKFDKKYQDIPIIAIIEKDSKEELEKIHDLRIERYVKRPIDYDNLIMNIRNLFSESEIGGFIEEALL
ncbi:response regulator [Candidatus Marinimicrobia bacterium MT.SAG.3]|nr:response regulator [Candidatus Marinimicrobia bacterium MT.SAG.3]TFB12605.1 response regulator [Candidatus Marinimicrobia bacterium MT.SAG.4]